MNLYKECESFFTVGRELVFLKRKDHLVNLLLIVGLVMTIVLGTFIVTEKNNVSGMSMSPTLQDAQSILVLDSTFNFEGIKFGDIVTANPEEFEPLVKRVVGLPGDKIEFKNNTLYRNDSPLTDFYTAEMLSELATPENDGSWDIVVPEGEYYLLSDNLSIDTVDSRIIGTVKASEIDGKVIVH